MLEAPPSSCKTSLSASLTLHCPSLSARPQEQALQTVPMALPLSTTVLHCKCGHGMHAEVGWVYSAAAPHHDRHSRRSGMLQARESTAGTAAAHLCAVLDVRYRLVVHSRLALAAQSVRVRLALQGGSRRCGRAAVVKRGAGWRHVTCAAPPSACTAGRRVGKRGSGSSSRARPWHDSEPPSAATASHAGGVRPRRPAPTLAFAAPAANQICSDPP